MYRAPNKPFDTDLRKRASPAHSAGKLCWRRRVFDPEGVRRISWTGLCRDHQACAVFNWTETAEGDLDPLLGVSADV